MKYAHVKNGSFIKELDNPPVKDATYEELAKRDVYPIIINKPHSINEWERFNGYNKEFTGSSLIYNYTIGSLSLSEYKKFRNYQLRTNARNALENKHDSFEMSMAALGVLPSGITNTITSNAGSVVNEYLTKRQELINGSTYSDVGSVYIQITSFYDSSQLDEDGKIIDEGGV